MTPDGTFPHTFLVLCILLLECMQNILPQQQQGLDYIETETLLKRKTSSSSVSLFYLHTTLE